MGWLTPRIVLIEIVTNNGLGGRSPLSRQHLWQDKALSYMAAGVQEDVSDVSTSVMCWTLDAWASVLELCVCTDHVSGATYVLINIMQPICCLRLEHRVWDLCSVCRQM